MITTASTDASLNTDATFDDRAWNVARYRWTMLTAGVFYPAWGVIYGLVYAYQNYDPLWQRLIISALCLGYAVLTNRPKIDERVLTRVFTTMVCLISMHTFFLVVRNDLNYPYVLGAYCVLFASGGCLLTIRPLLTYFVFSISLTLVIWLQRADLISFFFFLGSLTSLVVTFGTSKVILSLLHHVRQNARALSIESKKLGQVNRELRNVMNSLSQGFFSFGPDGRCGQVQSAACQGLIETLPAGKFVWDVLGADAEQRAVIAEWVDAVFTMPESVRPPLIEAGPGYAHSKGRMIGLNFYPVVENEVLVEIVVVATDRTAEVKALRDAQAEQARMKIIATIVEQRTTFQPFWRDLRGQLEQFRRSHEDLKSPVQTVEFRRFLHTMKGSFLMFSLAHFAEVVHRFEEQWAKPPTDAARVADLIQFQISELSELARKFAIEFGPILGTTILGQDRVIELPLGQVERLIGEIDRGIKTADIRRHLEAITLKPIRAYFDVFDTMSLDLAAGQGKGLGPLEFINPDLPIYPEHCQDLLTSFVHVFRNAVDHGLETPDERALAGKPKAGTITVEFISTERDGGEVLTIVVADDGRGIDPASIRAKAARMDLSTDGLDTPSLLNLVFTPYFSTREVVTEVSGRGVGLNAVKVAADALGGSVGIESELGRGTRIEVSIPLIVSHAVRVA